MINSYIKPQNSRSRLSRAHARRAYYCNYHLDSRAQSRLDCGNDSSRHQLVGRPQGSLSTLLLFLRVSRLVSSHVSPSSRTHTTTPVTGLGMRTSGRKRNISRGKTNRSGMKSFHDHGSAELEARTHYTEVQRAVKITSAFFRSSIVFLRARGTGWQRECAPAGAGVAAAHIKI